MLKNEQLTIEEILSTKLQIKKILLINNFYYIFQHTLIVADPKNLIDAPVIVGSRNIPPLLYQGTGLIADTENPLVLQLLTGDSTTYSYVPDQAIKEV